jgi:hypothetical protein
LRFVSRFIGANASAESISHELGKEWNKQKSKKTAISRFFKFFCFRYFYVHKLKKRKITRAKAQLFLREIQRPLLENSLPRSISLNPLQAKHLLPQ